MANQRSILPEMISVSRNCGFTLQLHKIFEEKLEDADFEILHRWLQIVEQENKLEVSREVKKFRYF
jgi:hypothetical protein